MKRDVAIVGAGYVGVPLAHTFAEAGKKVVLVDVDPAAGRAAEPGRELHRGRLVRGAAPLVESGRIAATTDYDELRGRGHDPDRASDPALRQREPDLRILERPRRRSQRASPRAPRRARVDDVPRNDP